MLLLNAAVQRIWPAAFIEIYGSYVTKLSSVSNSDLDLVVCFGDSASCSYNSVNTSTVGGGGGSPRMMSSVSPRKMEEEDRSVLNLIGVRGVIPLLQTLAEYLPPEMGMLDDEPILRSEINDSFVNENWFMLAFYALNVTYRVDKMILHTRIPVIKAIARMLKCNIETGEQEVINIQIDISIDSLAHRLVYIFLYNKCHI